MKGKQRVSWVGTPIQFFFTSFLPFPFPLTYLAPYKDRFPSIDVCLNLMDFHVHSG